MCVIVFPMVIFYNKQMLIRQMFLFCKISMESMEYDYKFQKWNVIKKNDNGSVETAKIRYFYIDISLGVPRGHLFQLRRILRVRG